MSADFAPLIIITVSVTLNVPYSSFKLKASENNETVRANLQKKPNSGFFFFFSSQRCWRRRGKSEPAAQTVHVPFCLQQLAD